MKKSIVARMEEMRYQNWLKANARPRPKPSKPHRRETEAQREARREAARLRAIEQAKVYQANRAKIPWHKRVDRRKHAENCQRSRLKRQGRHPWHFLTSEDLFGPPLQPASIWPRIAEWNLKYGVKRYTRRVVASDKWMYE